MGGRWGSSPCARGDPQLMGFSSSPFPLACGLPTGIFPNVFSALAPQEGADVWPGGHLEGRPGGRPHPPGRLWVRHRQNHRLWLHPRPRGGTREYGRRQRLPLHPRLGRGSAELLLEAICTSTLPSDGVRDGAPPVPPPKRQQREMRGRAMPRLGAAMSSPVTSRLPPRLAPACSQMIIASEYLIAAVN